MKITSTAKNNLSQIPTGVWVLGFVSMLMDISSEMIHSLLPLFMVTTIGASAFAVGLIEGLAESTALIVKVFSGTLSDYLGKRKGLALLGYGLGALTKPLFAIAPTIGVVLTARMLDRVGKGIRGAPLFTFHLIVLGFVGRNAMASPGGDLIGVKPLSSAIGAELLFVHAGGFNDNIEFVLAAKSPLGAGLI